MEPNEKLVELLERQKQDLVVRILKKHEEVQTEKVFSEKILASLSDLFFVMTKDFVIANSNEEFLHLLDFPAEDYGRVSLDALMDEGACRSLKARISAGAFRNWETEFTARGGGRIRVSINGSTFVTESGRVLHMMIARDMSDAHKMMSRIREAQEQLIHSGRLASLGEMAAGIGHELTQPLNAMLLFSRNCLKALEEPTINRELLEENLQIIIDRIKKASSIIKSLKSFARKEVSDSCPVEINSILINILKFLDSQLALSDIEVELDIDRSVPLVIGQEVRFEQVFLNVIQNAVQSMGETDSPRLTIKTYTAKSIEPESLQEKEYVVAAIRDTGTGISPDVMTRIFDPFFTTREVGTGMGLGLSIVDRIVRESGGFIKVESAPGEGACFLIHLPPCCEEDADAHR